MEKVTVIIPTFNRPEILEGAMNRIAFNLVYDGVVDIYIGNDGDYLPHMPDIHTRDSVVNVYVLDGPKRGLGANLNMLIRAANSSLILQMDDDHYLEKPLDINQFADYLIAQKNDIGWIRLFLGTDKDLGNDDPFYNFSAKMLERYWYPLPGVDELYIASNRPHLKLKDFHSKWYGYYPEGVTLGETETVFCHQYVNKHIELNGASSRPWVVIPVAAPSFDTWAHVGDSWQKQGL